MAYLLLGKEVSDALSQQLQLRVTALKEKGIVPTLAIVRLGENPGDLSYEKGAVKRAEMLGVAVRPVVLPEQTEAETLMENGPAWPQEGSVVELPEYIIVNLG